MTNYTIKSNSATNRRLQKLEEEGIEFDISTHEGRNILGYMYLNLQEQKTILSQSREMNRAQSRIQLREQRRQKRREQREQFEKEN